MTINGIKWPELISTGTMELPVIILLSGTAGAVVSRFSKPLAIVIFASGLLCLIIIAAIEMINEFKMFEWLRGFDKVATMWTLRRSLRENPERYCLYYNTYGGFDSMRARPAIVIEDITTHSFIAVYPGSYAVIKKCRQLGIRDTQHEEYCRAQQRAQTRCEAESRYYNKNEPLRRKRLNHYANVICKMFMGWRSCDDWGRLTGLPDGRLTIDLISCKATHDSRGPVRMYIADEINAWLRNECAKEAIPFALLRQITLTVDINTLLARTRKKKFLCHSFHCHSVIATNAREYHGEVQIIV